MFLPPPDAPPPTLAKVNIQTADAALLQLVADLGQAVLDPALADADLRATILVQTPPAVLQPFVARCVRELDRRNPYGPGRALRLLRTVENSTGLSEVAWSLDGRWLALGGDGGLWIWGLEDRRGPVALPQSWGVYALAFAVNCSAALCKIGSSAGFVLTGGGVGFCRPFRAWQIGPAGSIDPRSTQPAEDPISHKAALQFTRQPSRTYAM